MFGYKFYEGVVCSDGFKMSVQAHDGAYCEPRTNNASSYSRVEVGFPSDAESLLMPWIDGDDSNPTGQVYGYVPSSVILEVIEKHGGLVSGELPPLRFTAFTE
jgi:hypothetical protein